MINKIKTWVFGIKAEGIYAYTETSFTTTYPDNILSQNDWMLYCKVSSRVGR